MQTQQQPLHVHPDSDLARRLREAGPQPVILETEGVRYRVVRETLPVNLTDEPWANYDPEKVRAALDASAGAFKGIDTEALKKEIWAAREQDTPGRPA
ncbi:MAG: hypothetical protein ACR2JW_20140 [Thermomicrobiales bacterium]